MQQTSLNAMMKQGVTNNSGRERGRDALSLCVSARPAIEGIA